MNKLVMRREGTRLYCPSQDWQELLLELPERVDLNVTATRARSLPQLGTYWGLLGWVVLNVEGVSDNWLSDFLQLETGFVRHIAVPQPKSDPIYVRVPASKSFAECAQDRFNTYFEAALARLVKLCGYDPLPLYMDFMRQRGRRAA
jgi:hypothetical protein